MKIKATIAVVAILLLTQTAIAQFGQGRLSELSNQLATEAADFAESSYRNQSNNFRSNRSDVEAMMAAQQFSASSRIFYRMVVDRRRNQDVRDAFQVLQDVSRSVERYNLQRNNWYNIQRLMSDIGRELNVGGNDNNNQYPDSGRSSGRMTWKGRVDDDVRITVRGGTSEIETIGGSPYYNSTQSFTASLPPRRVNVRLQVKKSRGEVFIEQQPSRENGYAAVIRYAIHVAELRTTSSNCLGSREAAPPIATDYTDSEIKRDVEQLVNDRLLISNLCNPLEIGGSA